MNAITGDAAPSLNHLLLSGLEVGMTPQPYSLRQHRKAVGLVLSKLRKRSGLSQEEVAYRAGNMDRSHLSGLENGDHDPGLFTLAQIAAVYGLTLTQLVDQIEAKALKLVAQAANRREKRPNNH